MKIILLTIFIIINIYLQNNLKCEQVDPTREIPKILSFFEDDYYFLNNNTNNNLKPIIDWYECNLISRKPKLQLETILNNIKDYFPDGEVIKFKPIVECAYIPIPQLWSLQSTENPKTIFFMFVKRIRLKHMEDKNNTVKTKGQLFFHLTPLFESERTGINLISPTMELYSLELFFKLKGEIQIIIPHIRGTLLSRPLFSCYRERQLRIRMNTISELTSCLVHSMKSPDTEHEKFGIAFSTTVFGLDMLYLSRLTIGEYLQRTLQNNLKNNLQNGNLTEILNNFVTYHYAFGYNTYLLNRMLILEDIIQKKRLKKFGNLNFIIKKFIDKIILDSLMSPYTPKVSLLNYCKNFNHAVSDLFLNECDKDEFCKEKFTKKDSEIVSHFHTNPFFFDHKFYNYNFKSNNNTKNNNTKIENKNLEQHHSSGITKKFVISFYLQSLQQCYKGITPIEVRDILSEMYRHTNLRKFILPIIYRINRCNKIDFNFITDLLYHINHSYFLFFKPNEQQIREQIEIYRKNNLKNNLKNNNYLNNLNLAYVSYWATERNIGSSELIDRSSVEDYDTQSFYNFNEMLFLTKMSNYLYNSFIARINTGNAFYNDTEVFNITKNNYSDTYKSYSYNIYNDEDSFFVKKFDGEMLMMQGTLDAHTLYENSLQWRNYFIKNGSYDLFDLIYKNNDKYFIKFPLVGHQILLSSYIPDYKTHFNEFINETKKEINYDNRNIEDSNENIYQKYPNLMNTCGSQILISFIRNNGKNFTTTCLQEMYPDYIFTTNGDPILYRNQLFNTSIWSYEELYIARMIFGHHYTNIWEDGPLISVVNYYFLVIGLICSIICFLFLFTILFICLTISCFQQVPRKERRGYMLLKGKVNYCWKLFSCCCFSCCTKNGSFVDVLRNRNVQQASNAQDREEEEIRNNQVRDVIDNIQQQQSGVGQQANVGQVNNHTNTNNPIRHHHDKEENTTTITSSPLFGGVMVSALGDETSDDEIIEKAFGIQ
ncbi:hypothetical protein ABK040_000105 [Willaertia magna]